MGIINFKKIIGDAGKGIIVRANPIKDSEGMEVLQEGRPLPGPRVARLSLGSELSEETHVLTKQEILLGNTTRVESSRVREPRRTALTRGSQSGVL